MSTDAPVMNRREVAKALAAEISVTLDSEMQRLGDYSSGVRNDELLRNHVFLEDVEILAAIKRTVMPLQPAFAPGLVSAVVKNMRRWGIDDAGELVTRESLVALSTMVRGVKEYGGSIGIPDLIEDDDVQETLLMAFTDTDDVAEVLSVVRERGLLPVDTIRGLVEVRRDITPALSEGTL